MALKNVKKRYIVLGIIAFVLLAIWNPFKVTDPAHPWFNPDKFDFWDYEVGEETTEVFKVLFPLGTTKEKIDDIFIGAGSAKILKLKDFANVWRYDTPNNYTGYGRHYIVIYDDENRLLNMSTFVGGYLYPAGITKEKLRKLNNN